MPLEPHGVPSRAAIQAAINERTQGGTVSVSGSALAPGSFVTADVTFPVPFTEAPHVQLTAANAPGGGAYLTVRVAPGVTATGFTVRVINAGTTDATWTNLVVSWLAVAK